MWIFLVMMTIVNLVGTKRVRKEPRQISVTSSGEGSEGELNPKLCMLRRRKRAMASVDATGWEASSGPVMRKKDIHLLSTAETSQSASKDEEDMKSKIVALEEEVRINEQKVKQSEEKCEKMFQFIISKFPDSQNILCPPDEDEARAYNDITDLL
ncbi:unnamed protein product [Lactuca virosa]|uniref:RAB6-interacting golgin n=1 Tax=Lactuca virosa TaxID=75947 RepID=A0AAU9LPH3_9ASTR|nr:unnamed protein product [Lactuca virosa]